MGSEESNTGRVLFHNEDYRRKTMSQNMLLNSIGFNVNAVAIWLQIQHVSLRPSSNVCKQSTIICFASTHRCHLYCLPVPSFIQIYPLAQEQNSRKYADLSSSKDSLNKKYWFISFHNLRQAVCAKIYQIIQTRFIVSKFTN